MRRLVVGLDALAALREVAAAPALPAAATLAAMAGAEAVRLGISEEHGLVSERDLREVLSVGAGLELRMAPIPSLIKAALEARPTRVLLAASPGREGAALPLDLRAWGGGLPPALRTLEEAGFAVAALIGPDLNHVKAAHAVGARGVEFYTGALVDLPAAERSEALSRLADAARLAAKLRLAISLGGRLDERNLGAVLEAAPMAAAVTVGRAWVARALLVGIERATRDLREAIR